MANSSRKANGQGSTYKIKGTNSYRTVYRVNGGVVTATAKDRQTSRALAKAKLSQVPITDMTSLIRNSNLTLGEFMDGWLSGEDWVGNISIDDNSRWEEESEPVLFFEFI